MRKQASANGIVKNGPTHPAAARFSLSSGGSAFSPRVVLIQYERIAAGDITL
jgi:hypothetical protein